MTEWIFLEPWRLVLRELVQFHNYEDVVVGSLHETMRIVRVNFFFIYDIDDPELGRCEHGYEDIFYRKLREALELIALALHYDKRTWSWLRPVFNFPEVRYDTNVLRLLNLHFTMLWAIPSVIVHIKLATKP